MNVRRLRGLVAARVVASSVPHDGVAGLERHRHRTRRRLARRIRREDVAAVSRGAVRVQRAEVRRLTIHIAPLDVSAASSALHTVIARLSTITRPVPFILVPRRLRVRVRLLPDEHVKVERRVLAEQRAREA